MTHRNQHGQPIGASLDWGGASLPGPEPLVGRHITLRRLDPASHAAELFTLYRDDDPTVWTYLPLHRPETEHELRSLFDALCADPTNAMYVIERDGALVGFLEYLRIHQRDGTIEIGFITLSTSLQRTTAATEALALLMRHAFSLGYRRLEWKCDSLNEPSRRAASRLGFTYEGTFRQATHYKGRNRDTAWFSIIDADWPPIDAALRQWLDPANFDDRGVQRRSLDELRSTSG